MHFLSCRSRGAAALLFALGGSSSAETLATHAGTFSVVAFATDVHSVVMRTPDGPLQRFKESEILPGSEWRVREVAADRVTLQNDAALQGQTLRMTLKLGESIDLDAVRQMSARLQAPISVPDRASLRAVHSSAKPTR